MHLLDLRAGRVYVRTFDAVFRTHFRSVRELFRRLGNPYFVTLNHGVVANLRHCKSVDLCGRLLGVAVGYRSGSRVFEWITISRRCQREFRLHFLLPRAG